MNFILFYSSLILIELNLLKYFLVDDDWAKFSAIRLAICFSLKAFVFPRER